MIRLPQAIATLFCLLCAPIATAHELWLEASEWQVSQGDEITVNIINGEEFSGARLSYFPNRAERFETVSGGTTTPVKGRPGDLPALTTVASSAGLMTVLYETAPSRITYKEWEKFAAFAAHKNFGPDILDRHLAAGYPPEGFAEAYTRHAKALIAVGDSAGADRSFGLATEFVALTNPYASDFDGTMRVQLLRDGAPITNAQVEVFTRDAYDVVVVDAAHRTDAQGIAAIAVKSGHTYLFDHVILQHHAGETDAVWDTLWAALTFAVP